MMEWYEWLICSLLFIPYMFFLVLLFWPHRSPPDPPHCPHGLAWDDCPDCCH